MNNQKEHGNDMDSDLVKDKDNTQPSETTEDARKIPEELEAQYYIQIKSARSQNLFDLDPEWIEDKFITREPDFFEMLYLKCIPGHTYKHL